MKYCKYCNTRTNEYADKCPSCSAVEFVFLCDNCGVSFESRFCPNCGKSPYEVKKTCPNCGNITSDTFCSKCGTNLAANTPAQQVYGQPYVVNNYYTTTQNGYVYQGKPRSKWTAFFLCLFLGYIGIHKFYEGKIFMGILYIFTLGLFGIGWLVDWIVILTKPNPYYVR